MSAAERGGRRRVAWVLLGLVTVGALGVLVARSTRPSDAPAARVTRLEQQIACPVCDGQSVAESNAPEARAIRDDIPERVADGQTDAEIRAAYVARYGDGVLLAPAGSGLGLVAWALPLCVLALGGLGVVVAVRRWSRVTRLVPDADDVATVEAARREAGEQS